MLIYGRIMTPKCPQTYQKYTFSSRYTQIWVENTKIGIFPTRTVLQFNRRTVQWGNRPTSRPAHRQRRSLYKFVTIYRRVDKEESLELFFSETHLQLAEKLPGLRKSEVSRVTGKPGGESRFHLMYELYFDSEGDFKRALVSEIGLALMQALKPWGEAKVITWFYAEAFEEATNGTG